MLINECPDVECEGNLSFFTDAHIKWDLLWDGTLSAPEVNINNIEHGVACEACGHVVSNLRESGEKKGVLEVLKDLMLRIKTPTTIEEEPKIDGIR